MLAVVTPPMAPGCLYLQPLGDAVYRVVAGDGADRLSAKVSQPATPLVVWVTGHTLPYADAADHQIMAPYTPGCGHGPAIEVDSWQTLPDWIAGLLPAVLASLAPPTAVPGPTHRPGSV